MKAIRAGELRHVAVFKRAEITTYPSGEDVLSIYRAFQTMRAAFEQLDRTAGAEPVHADQVAGKTVAKIRTRYFSGLKTSDIVALDDVDYEILAIENTQNLDRELVCTVVTMDKAS